MSYTVYQNTSSPKVQKVNIAHVMVDQQEEVKTKTKHQGTKQVVQERPGRPGGQETGTRGDSIQAGTAGATAATQAATE